MLLPFPPPRHSHSHFHLLRLLLFPFCLFHPSHKLSNKKSAPQTSPSLPSFFLLSSSDAVDYGMDERQATVHLSEMIMTKFFFYMIMRFDFEGCLVSMCVRQFRLSQNDEHGKKNKRTKNEEEEEERQPYELVSIFSLLLFSSKLFARKFFSLPPDALRKRLFLRSRCTLTGYQKQL